jgi:hypothetical protein
MFTYILFAFIILSSIVLVAFLSIVFLAALLGDVSGNDIVGAQEVKQSSGTTSRSDFIKSHLLVYEYQSISCTTSDQYHQNLAYQGGEDYVERRHSCSICIVDGAHVASGGGVAVISKDGAFDICAICLAAYGNRQEVCESNNPSCRHVFHKFCMCAWLEKHNECPVCRQVYLLETV